MSLLRVVPEQAGGAVERLIHAPIGSERQRG
jgi:hypothetical protein